MLRILGPSAIALLFATQAQAQPIPNGLVLRDSVWFWSAGCPNPTGGATEQEFLDQGVPVTVVNAAAFATVDLFDYTMIFLADCQKDVTYNAWNARLADLDQWVNAGGFLAVHATRDCDAASVQADIPGGLPTRVVDHPGVGTVQQPGHPVLTGVPASPTGSSLAHDGYTSTGNPSDVTLITSNNTGNTILFERTYGNGTIIYGGLTYECYSHSCGSCGVGDAGTVLKNEVSWGSTFTLCGTLDSDGDGMGDDCDVCPFDPLDDNDGDGICDSSDPCPNGDNFKDTDGDGVPDGCDVCPVDNPDDADGDGLCDSCTSGNHDNDGDFIGACFDNCPDAANAKQTDSDNDLVGDACDLCPGFDDLVDGDLDGWPDGCDNCPNLASNDQSDPDGDGVGTPCDICPAGDDAIDTDGDTIPDACDRCPGFDDAIDADGDGVPDGCDNCPADPNPSQRDEDADGYGEACDCEDLDPYSGPHRVEFCDGVDNDCDGEIDENAIDADEVYVDADHDGHGDPDQVVLSCDAPHGYSRRATDCDDSQAGIHPNAPEICDGIDNDCDGEIDGAHCGEPEPEPVEHIDGGCEGCSTSTGGPAGALALLLTLGFVRRRR